MSNFLKQYGDTEGPLGVPMKDSQAFAVEKILATLPDEDRKLRRVLTTKASTELLPGERADISWISTELVDADNEIVIAKGMNDAQFAANPLVTMAHNYNEPPVGRSLWRKKCEVRSTEYGVQNPNTSGLRLDARRFQAAIDHRACSGIRAKTFYPSKPADWPSEDWAPDHAFGLIKAGLLNGKSVGFVCLAAHAPTAKEISSCPVLANVTRIIDHWLLIEYACAFFPANPAAIVEQISKMSDPPVNADLDLTAYAARFVTALSSIDPITLVHDAIQRVQGRI
jgi:hypothetical protein